jgi:hypothetical protein
MFLSFAIQLKVARSFAGARFGGKARGDLRDDVEVEVMLAGEEGVVGESKSNSLETVFMQSKYSIVFCGFAFS